MLNHCIDRIHGALTKKNRRSLLQCVQGHLVSTSFVYQTICLVYIRHKDVLTTDITENKIDCPFFVQQHLADYDCIFKNYYIEYIRTKLSVTIANDMWLFDLHLVQGLAYQSQIMIGIKVLGFDPVKRNCIQNFSSNSPSVIVCYHP